MSTIYVAQEDFLDELCNELGDITKIVGNLVFSSVDKPDACFAQDIWHDPVIATFESISDAARILRGAGKYWYLNPLENVRRSRLIEEQLVKLPRLEQSFPVSSIPPIGCFTLLDKNTLVYSIKRAKKWPMGLCYFIEDKENPPNRAYLKLWEALFLHGTYPKAQESVLDLGASPGGWTYVMHTFGTHVTAVDKAPLDSRIAKLPHITFLQQSAFAINPLESEKVWDWVICDVACYPDKLYDLVQRWIASNNAKNMIFTIKLQGETDLDIIRKFQAIPHSHTRHLFHNKHEATFFYSAVGGL